MNLVIMTGHLGKDPEMSFTQAGLAVTKGTLAVGQPPKNGQKVSPIWLNLTLFGKPAETFAQHLAKGDNITIQGKLVESEYTKNGVKNIWREVIVNDFTIHKSASFSQNQSGGKIQPQPVGASAGGFDPNDPYGSYPSAGYPHPF